MEQGLVYGLGLRGNTLLWSLNNARTPGAAYAITLARRTNPKATPVTRQVTWTDDQGLDLASFPLPELIRYPAFDGRADPGVPVPAAGPRRGAAIPFIVDYHGGPEGQARPGFNGQLQYLLSRGFGILMPNVRGSTGYGRDYQMMDDYQGRWGSVKDGVDAAEWLVKSGYAEPGRIATYGGSYGGFMSVACIVEDQERVDRGERPERLFGACVDIVGIVNMKTFLERTSGYRRKLREVEYGPLTDPEFLLSVSPMQRVDKIQVPVFIAHGFNDPRVPVEEAMQLSMALKEAKREPRVFIAPDEGHGFAKLDNRIYFGERVAASSTRRSGAGRRTGGAGRRGAVATRPALYFSPSTACARRRGGVGALQTIEDALPTHADPLRFRRSIREETAQTGGGIAQQALHAFDLFGQTRPRTPPPRRRSPTPVGPAPAPAPDAGAPWPDTAGASRRAAWSSRRRSRWSPRCRAARGAPPR